MNQREWIETVARMIRQGASDEAIEAFVRAARAAEVVR